jgi:hypothetical protein
VEASIDGGLTSSTSDAGLTLSYVGFPIIDVVDPPYGPITGNTVVHFYGAGMMNVDSAMCRFGDSAVVKSIYHSEHHTSCISPALSSTNLDDEIDGGASALIWLSVNGKDFISTNVVFEYVRVPEVYSIDPSFGSESGNTRVYISGKSFGAQGHVLCEFGSIAHRVLAIRKSDTLLYCDSPAHIPTQVDFRMSLNGQQYISSDLLLTFDYLDAHSVHKLVPSSGPKTGGTLIHVMGTNFFNSSSLSCRFYDSTLVSASYLNSSTIACVSPPIVKRDEYSCVVEVSINGIDFSYDETVYSYTDELVLGEAYPLIGPTTGGTNISFNVLEGAFIERYICNFISLGFVSPLMKSIDGSDSCYCVTPDTTDKVYKHASNFSVIQVSVMATGSASSKGSIFNFDFRYIDNVNILSIIPTEGKESGGSWIHIYSNDYFPISSEIRCLFGEESADGLYVSQHVIKCRSPSHRTGAVDMSISYNDGVDYFQMVTLNNQRIYFTYVSELNINNIYPLLLYKEGTQSVDIYGS